MNAIIERKLRVAIGIPMYSLKVLKIANNKNAVKNAPKPSIRNRPLGFDVNLFTNCCIAYYLPVEFRLIKEEVVLRPPSKDMPPLQFSPFIT